MSFADTSGPGGLGQLFVAHNDDSEIGDASPSDIEFAQFDEATGDLVQQVDIAGTNGYTIESSLLATQPAVDDPATGIDETRTRLLFFVASDGLGTQALFRVLVTGDPAGRSATINGAAATSTGDIDATPYASPAIVFLRNALNVPTAYVAVGAAGGLKTFAASNLATGPAAALGGPAQTPVVPVQPTGLTPSPAFGNPVTSAPFVYVASDTGDTTTVYQLSGTTSALSVLRASEALPGAPAPGLSTTQVSEPSVAQGKLVVTTGANLYLLTTQDLDRAGQLAAADNLVAGSTGFRQTVASASGDHVYAMNDQGQHVVLRLSDGKPVSGGEFSADGSATPLANGGVGQPSITRGFVLYGGGRGAFAYRNSDRTDPVVDPLRTPTPDTTVDGTVTFSTLAWDARGIESVIFRSNGQPFGIDRAADSGSPFGSPGAAYSVAIDTGNFARGVFLIDAVATDSSGRTATSEQRRITIRGATDDRPPSIDFTKLKENATLGSTTVIEMTASDDRSVRSVELYNGSQRVCIDLTAPYACTFAPRGRDVGKTTLFATATDSEGQTASAARNVLVSRLRPVSMSSRIAPRRDRNRPYQFTVTGKVTRPATVRTSDGCGEGLVSVQVKAGSKTVSTRRVTLSGDCSYRSSVAFAVRSRLGRSGRLKFGVRFLGNDVLAPRSASVKTARAG